MYTYIYIHAHLSLDIYIYTYTYIISYVGTSLSPFFLQFIGQPHICIYIQLPFLFVPLYSFCPKTVTQHAGAGPNGSDAMPLHGLLTLPCLGMRCLDMPWRCLPWHGMPCLPWHSMTDHAMAWRAKTCHDMALPWHAHAHAMSCPPMQCLALACLGRPCHALPWHAMPWPRSEPLPNGRFRVTVLG